MRVTRLRSVDQDAPSDLLLLDVTKQVRATHWLRDNLGMGLRDRARLVSQAHRGLKPVVLAGIQHGEAMALAERMADEAGMTTGIRLTV